MTVYFASDHAGFELKNVLSAFVCEELGFEVEDCGAYANNKDDDYVDFVKVAAEAVSKNPVEDKAIVLGGSGQGEAMCANRYKGVRAATYYHHNLDIVTLSREHNNANVLSLGARFVNEEQAKEAVRVWLNTPFTGTDRHVRRIEKLG
jgi:ribose 5-phosphate isomerase B